MALVLEALLLDHSRVAELEAARADMLPKLAGWLDELAATIAGAPAATQSTSVGP